MNIHRIGRDISVLAGQLEVPGIGFLPVNAFVLHASEPERPLPLTRVYLLNPGQSLDAGDLQARQPLWATIDSPWVHTVDPARYLGTLGYLRDLDPALILSTHLPPAPRRTPEFLQTLTAAPAADAFTGPDQTALEQMAR